MALKITCPHCGHPRRLGEPFPLPGTEVQCNACGRALAISYPTGMVERLRSKGLRFAGTDTEPKEEAEEPEPGEPHTTEPPPPPPASESTPDFQPLLSPEASGAARLRSDDSPTPASDDRTEEATRPVNAPPARSPSDHVAPQAAPPKTANEFLNEDGPTDSTAPFPPPSQTPSKSQAPAKRPPFESKPAALSTPAIAPNQRTSTPKTTEPTTSADSPSESSDLPWWEQLRQPKVLLRIALGTLKWTLLLAFFIATFGLGAVAYWMSTRKNRLVKWVGVGGIAFGLSCIVGAVYVAWWAYDQYLEWTTDLPSVEEIREYYPPTVTVIYDAQGRVLGELYDPDAEGGGRRYVVPIGCDWEDETEPSTDRNYECIPKLVQDAFVAAEDGNFWKHDGVDYWGIVRAARANLIERKKAQGASTITMQVARNMPALKLSKEKSYERKVREIALAQLMEEAFDKEHILMLYLNQIYLGSQAYGVEAAARVYFSKHVGELTIAEAAILAGLPKSPHNDSPHVDPSRSRERQEYVLGQMKTRGFITGDEYDQAMNERVLVQKSANPFLRQAPYFTEEVKRYLEVTYGPEKVYQDGLEVHTTCDLDLQRVAQRAVKEHTLWADKRRGWRGEKEHIDLDMIPDWRDKQDLQIREAISKKRIWVADKDSAPGYDPVPTTWELQDPTEVAHPADKEVYEAVVLEVTKEWARVGIGRHEAIIPIEWTWWAREPNPERSWRYSPNRQRDMTNVLEEGDIVDIRLRNYDDLIRTETFQRLKTVPSKPRGEDVRLSELRNPEDRTRQIADARFAGVLKEKQAAVLAEKGLPFAELHQTSDLQGALLSYRLEDGAIQAMVGGVDWISSQFNRAIQAERQVGSTIKPFIYTAGILEGHYTAASRIMDQPYIPAGGTWKPKNAGNDYDGLMTLRRALQKSKNTVTARILEKTKLDPVFELIGPTLRIGYDSPDCLRTHIPTDQVCTGTESPSTLDGMKWCEVCDPSSCPVTRVNPDGLYWLNTATPADLMEVEGIDQSKANAVLRLRDGHYAGRLRSVRDLNQLSWSDETRTALVNAASENSDFECVGPKFEQYGNEWCNSCSINLRLCSWLPVPDMSQVENEGYLDRNCKNARLAPDGTITCLVCDLTLGLGTSSLTMLELAQGYSPFPTGGKRVTPHFITKVIDGDESATVIEEWQPPENGWPQVVDEEVAGLGHWLVSQVTKPGGTAAIAGRLVEGNTKATQGVAGKTGTTNQYNDAWFVGYTPSVITVSWIGHDDNEKLGVSSTGGRTALPIWLEYMNEVIPPPSTETPDGEEASEPLTYERWAELIDETPERFQWHSINENPDHPLFGTISKEVTYTTGENRSKKYPVTMPFNRKKNSDDWNIPEKGSVVEVVLEEDLDW